MDIRIVIQSSRSSIIVSETAEATKQVQLSTDFQKLLLLRIPMKYVESSPTIKQSIETQTPIQMKEVNQASLQKVLEALKGGQQLEVRSILDLWLLYPILAKLEIKEYLENLREGIWSNTVVFSEETFYGVGNNRSLHRKDSLSHLTSTKSIMSMGDMSPSTIVRVLSHYSQFRDSSDQTVDFKIVKALKMYLSRNNLKSSKFLAEIGKEFNELWLRHHHQRPQTYFQFTKTFVNSEVPTRSSVLEQLQKQQSDLDDQISRLNTQVQQSQSKVEQLEEKLDQLQLGKEESFLIYSPKGTGDTQMVKRSLKQNQRSREAFEYEHQDHGFVEPKRDSDPKTTKRIFT